MSVRYEIVRLLARLGVALGLALGLAAIAAVVHGGGYLRSLEICCYVVGALMLVLGGGGQFARSRLWPRRRERIGRLVGLANGPR